MPVDLAGPEPARRGRAAVAVTCAAVAVWGLVAAGSLRNDVGTPILWQGSHGTSPEAHGIVDMRREVLILTGRRNPVVPGDFVVWTENGLEARPAAASGDRRLVIDRGDVPLELRLDAEVPQDAVSSTGLVGVFSYTAGTGVYVDDWLGLANPVGSRIPSDPAIDKPGHRKVLPAAWTVARFATPSDRGYGPVRTGQVRAAREALRCGRLEGLLRGVTEPMSPRRFAANLRHAFANTRLRIPADPREARDRLCGRPAR